MALNTQNIRAFGDVNQRVLTAPFGATVPTSPLLSAVPTGYYDVGLLDDETGLTEDSGLQTTNKFVWQGSAIGRVLKSQATKSFTFNSVEENAVTMGLLRPASTPTTTGATAEVQTITITGPPTGGTFTIYSIWGSYNAAYNVTTANLATALTNAFGFTVAVSGTVSVSYVITFPANLGNVPLMTVSNQLTGGGATISIATTTPGVTGTNTWDVMPYTGLNLRTFLIYLIDGGVHKCLYIPNGEAVGTGSPKYQGGDWTMWQYTVNCYIDAVGKFYREISDNPAASAGLYA